MNKEILGKKIKSLRTQNGLSQSDLGLKCNVSQNFIYLIESGRKSPSMSTLGKISKSLNVSVSYFLEEDLERDLIELAKKYDLQSIVKSLHGLLSEQAIKSK